MAKARLKGIQESPVFQKLSAEQLNKLADISREETYEAGQRIFREGEQARVLYMLEEGKVILEMRIAPLPERRPSPQATVDVVIRGEVFGWSAISRPHVFTTTAQAVDKCKVVAIDGAKLLELMGADPSMGYEVMSRLAEVIVSRLMHTRQTLLSERGLALLSQAYPF